MSTPEILEGYATGVWSSNCYIAAARRGETAVVVDCGQDAAPLLLERLDALGLRCEALLLTHGHVDHIWTAKDLCDAAGVEAWMHPADAWLLEDPGAALGAAGLGRLKIETPAKLNDLSDGQHLTFGGLNIGVRHTPGHTPGSCVFITDGVVFTGDLIFQGSIGRTDLPRGSLAELMEAIRGVVLPLGDEVAVLSGHGPETTVGAERRTNPFVLADARGDLPKLLGL